MSGLLEKDLRILASRKKNVIVFLLIALILAFTTEGLFIVGYLPFLMSILTISTLSYDEMNNGLKYMMILPIDATMYVREKFIFCIGGCFISWLASVFIMLAVYIIKHANIILYVCVIEAICILPVIVIIETIMLTAQLKYGMEKSRIILATIGGIIVVTAFGVKALMTYAGESIQALAMTINALPLWLFLVVFFGIAIVVVAACKHMSIKIMKNKEF